MRLQPLTQMHTIYICMISIRACNHGHFYDTALTQPSIVTVDSDGVTEGAGGKVCVGGGGGGGCWGKGVAAVRR